MNFQKKILSKHILKVVTKMKIVIAVDSFKGSLSSLEAGEAVKTGICKNGGTLALIPKTQNPGIGCFLFCRKFMRKERK